MKKVVKIGLAAVLALALAGCGKVADDRSEIPSDLGNGTTYYISSSLGDDSNDGLSVDTPFKTLNPVNAMILQPGDNVLFKRGDVFESAHFSNNGSGLAENGRWITIDAYGKGDNPLFTGNGAELAAITLWDGVTGGYRIRNIDVSDYLQGICCGHSYGREPMDGLIISGCNISDITTEAEFDPDRHFANGAALAFGMWLYNVRNAEVTDVNITNTDCPIQVYGGLMTFDRIDIFYSRIQGVMLYGGLNLPDFAALEATDGGITFKNSRIIDTGSTGLYLGTTGMLIENTKNCLVSNVEVAYTVNGVGGYDACALDWEQNNLNCVIENVYAHDNDGPFLLAMEHEDSLGNSKGNIIRNCLSVNNGRRDVSAEGSFLNHSSYPNGDQYITIENCVDIGRPGSVPYTYESGGNKRLFGKLEDVSRLRLENFVSGVLDVCEGFDKGSTGALSTENASVENAHLVLSEGGSLRTEFSGSDYTFSCYVKGGAELVFLSEDADNGYFWVLGDSGLTVGKKVDGKYTKLAQAKTEVDLSVWHRVMISAEGGVLNAWLDGTQMLSVEDSSFTCGAAGINAVGECSVDELLIWREQSTERKATSYTARYATFMGEFKAVSENGAYGWHLPEITFTPENLSEWIYRPFFAGWGRIAGKNAGVSVECEFDVGTDKTVNILLLNATDNGTVYFEFTTDGENWNSIELQTSCMSSDDYFAFAHSMPPFEMLKIDMSGISEWTGTVKGMRLRFAADSGRFALKYITASK